LLDMAPQLHISTCHGICDLDVGANGAVRAHSRAVGRNDRFEI
jgi:hypothetical protein